MLFDKTFLLLVLLLLTACVSTQNVSDTLSYSGTKKKVDLSKVDFKALKATKKGESCMTSFIGIPLYGNTAVEKAAENGDIGNVQLRAETARWVFPIFTQCTIVYGDATVMPIRD